TDTSTEVDADIMTAMPGSAMDEGPASPRDRWHQRGWRRWTGSAPPLLLVICGLVGLTFAGPLLYLLRHTLTGSMSLAELWALYSSERTLGPLGQTLRLAAATAVATGAVGTGLAWLTTRTDLPLRRLWATVAPLPLVFPSFVGS